MGVSRGWNSIGTQNRMEFVENCDVIHAFLVNYTKFFARDFGARKLASYELFNSCATVYEEQVMCMARRAIIEDSQNCARRLQVQLNNPYNTAQSLCK